MGKILKASTWRKIPRAADVQGVLKKQHITPRTPTTGRRPPKMSPETSVSNEFISGGQLVYFTTQRLAAKILLESGLPIKRLHDYPDSITEFTEVNILRRLPKTLSVDIV
jgi:hypothetical protein